MAYCIYCLSKVEDSITFCPDCGKEQTTYMIPQHHLRPGTILNNKILVGAALGEGGFGITYMGRDLNLDMKVAVKEFYPNGLVNRSNTVSSNITFSMSQNKKEFFVKSRERFINEAKILAKFVDEPGIVSVKDYFEENNTAYIVMEYLDGKDFKQYIKDNGLLKEKEIIQMFIPVMITLEKVHVQGLIHRDISPDNIRISKKGIKLLDFGASREYSDPDDKSLSVMLKPGYAPEEQYRSKGNQGPWTDVYALCATMYKCMTGITPETSNQRLYKDELKKPSELGIEISSSFESVLIKGMSVLQENRYQSMNEMIDDIVNERSTKTNEKDNFQHDNNNFVDRLTNKALKSEKITNAIVVCTVIIYLFYCIDTENSIFYTYFLILLLVSIVMGIVYFKQYYNLIKSIEDITKSGIDYKKIIYGINHKPFLDKNLYVGPYAIMLPNGTIIRLKTIVWTYIRQSGESGFRSQKTIIFSTILGKQYELFLSENEWSWFIENYKKELSKELIIGYNAEQKKKYKTLCKSYRKGLYSLDDFEDNILIAATEKKSMTKRKLLKYFLVCLFFTVIFLAIIM